MGKDTALTIERWWGVLNGFARTGGELRFPNRVELQVRQPAPAQPRSALSRRSARIHMRGELLDALVRLDEVRLALDRFSDAGVCMRESTEALLENARSEAINALEGFGAMTTSELASAVERVGRLKRRAGRAVRDDIAAMRERMRRGIEGDVRTYFARKDFIAGYA